MRGDGEFIEEPIIQLGAEGYKPGNYRYIPVGFEPEDPKEDPAYSHSIVIVGFSNNSFILNDPASFPFVECSDEELVNISGFSHRESRSEIEARTREVLPDIPKSELDEELKLGPRRRYFQCFSVCPQNMRLPLLRDDYKLRKEEKQRKRRPSGLFLSLIHI